MAKIIVQIGLQIFTKQFCTKLCFISINDFPTFFFIVDEVFVDSTEDWVAVSQVRFHYKRLQFVFQIIGYNMIDFG